MSHYHYSFLYKSPQGFGAICPLPRSRKRKTKPLNHHSQSGLPITTSTTDCWPQWKPHWRNSSSCLRMFVGLGTLIHKPAWVGRVFKAHSAATPSCGLVAIQKFRLHSTWLWALPGMGHHNVSGQLCLPPEKSRPVWVFLVLFIFLMILDVFVDLFNNKNLFFPPHESGLKLIKKNKTKTIFCYP